MEKKALTQRRIDYLKKTVGEISYPPSSGPKGGGNVKGLPGWSRMGHSGWTKAAIGAGYHSRNYWGGSAPMPSRAFPSEVVNAARNAPEDIR